MSATVDSSDTSLEFVDVYGYDLAGNRLSKAHTGPGGGDDETCPPLRDDVI
jgi:hypothetical protein